MEEEVLNERLAGADHVPVHIPPNADKAPAGRSTSSIFISHIPLQFQPDNQWPWKTTRKLSFGNFKLNWRYDPSSLRSYSALTYFHPYSTDFRIPHLCRITPLFRGLNLYTYLARLGVFLDSSPLYTFTLDRFVLSISHPSIISFIRGFTDTLPSPSSFTVIMSIIIKRKRQNFLIILFLNLM